MRGRLRRAASKAKAFARHPLRSIGKVRSRMDKLDIVQFRLRGAIVKHRVQHHSGPRAVGGLHAPIVFCLLRNGIPWLASFMAHHRALGFEHFVMLDNGSSDGTLEAMAAMPDVTVLTTGAPYKAYENTLKRYLVDAYGAGRWCLFVDIDEQFDYPLRADVPLTRLIAYCELIDANCLITQMLDMFADRPMADLDIRGHSDLRETFSLYELAHIRAEPYPFGKAAPVKMHWGGIRKAVFGTDNGLTKVSFFRNDPDLEPFVHWHHVKRGRFADLSGVLFHFPFEAGFAEKVREAAASGRYGYHTTGEYRAYGAQGNIAALRMKSDQARAFTGTDALVEQGFLVVSERYREFVAGENGVQTSETAGQIL